VLNAPENLLLQSKHRSNFTASKTYATLPSLDNKLSSKEIKHMTSNDLKRGLVFLLEAAPCLVLDVSSQSPSARGGSTLIKTKYRNLLTGQVLEKTFKAGDRVDEADFEKRKGQFLYADGDNGVFMDLESYEQYELGDDMYGPVKGFLLDGTEVVMGVFEGQVVSIEPPMIVELQVTETAPAIKNATAQAQTKEAVLETGLRLQVPSYLESNERVKVDTREGRFVSRA
jgi:elongation factor P